MNLIELHASAQAFQFIVISAVAAILKRTGVLQLHLISDN